MPIRVEPRLSIQEVGGSAKDELTLTYGGAEVGGPRVYLIEEEENSNTMFLLKGKEFSFQVELSTMACGFNAALYFVGMTANRGGAENGTNYCDAQAVTGTYCSELDVMEANRVAQQ
jgi:cellulose 1,4-beta-cellobiosidase